jgi:hypothetical protein
MAAITPSVSGQLKVLQRLVYAGLKEQMENPGKQAQRCEDWVRMMDEVKFLIHLMRQG